MESPRTTEEGRRSYWTRQMDSAYRFMLAVQDHPVEECGEPLRSIPEAVRRAGITVLFTPLPHVLGLPRLFLLRSGLLDDFLGAAEELNARGWALRIEDAYRTRVMQKHLALKPEIFSMVVAKARWELGGREPDVDLVRRRLAALVAMNPRVGTHCSGSAVDVSVVEMKDGVEVDRGGPYLEVSEKSPMDSPFISEGAARNRVQITTLLGRHGFRPYPFEFWHYNRGDAYEGYLSGTGRPARYGPVDFDPGTAAMTSIEEALTPLNSEEEILGLIRTTLHRESEPGRNPE